MRAILEISVVSIGWYLGGKVGIGTLLFAFGIGPCVALGLYLVDKIFHDYGPFEGEMEGRKNGALISMEKGKAVAFAIFNLQARGEMFVTHNDPVYPGMIVGLSPKPGDMIINVMKGKKLTNMRTQGTDENVVLTPVRKMSIAEQLSILNTDEALEITPESCRLRKAILDPHERKRSEKSGAAA